MGQPKLSVYLQQKLVPELEALHLAVQFGQRELAQYFLLESERVGLLSSSDHNEFDELLTSAVKSGNFDVMRAVFESGVPYTSDALYFAIQEAIFRDDIASLSYLIDSTGYDIRYFVEGCYSLLALAAFHGNSDILRLLALYDDAYIKSDKECLYQAITKEIGRAHV